MINDNDDIVISDDVSDLSDVNDDINSSDEIIEIVKRTNKVLTDEINNFNIEYGILFNNYNKLKGEYDILDNHYKSQYTKMNDIIAMTTYTICVSISMNILLIFYIIS